MTVRVEDFSSGGLPGVQVTLSASPAGLVSLSPTTGNTDGNGELVVQVTGVAVGSVTVTAEALSLTDTLTFTVGTTGTVFGIDTPSTDPCSLFTTDPPLEIIVTAPAPISSVRFATTLGTFEGLDPIDTGQVIEQNVAGGFATASFNSLVAGVATIQVFDVADPSTMDTLEVAVSAPILDADNISLQASATVVAPSIGDVSNTVTLTATVKTATDQVVGSAPVAFSIENPTGGGETISPVVAFTNAYGVATSTFTSGALSSGAEGVKVNAVVLSMPLVTDSIYIVIGGTAGSVIIGRSTKVSSNATNTAYILPMSVLVADSNGNPVSGITVSLSAWPTNYYTGYT